MLILSLETSTQVCSVALHRNRDLIAYAEILIDKSHAEKITLLIEQVCSEAKIELSNIDAVAVSKGPGSYTGLRIASSTAKGLCFALNKPLVAIDTLEAIAWQVSKSISFLLREETKTTIIPMIDARRMEVFTAQYNAKVVRISTVEAKIIDADSFKAELETGKLIFCGNGADKCKATINHENAVFIDGIYPRAKEIGYLACFKSVQNHFEDIVDFEPFYLKDFYMKTS